jgi:sugar phosphate isomerase/epimerase
LTAYLQELHNQRLATTDVTTLLLNCYTKLKDITRLDAFIKADEHASRPDDELPFDLETVIRVCRQAGYFDHAVYLAKRYGQHEEYLRIQIEDREDWKDAVAYIRQLDSRAVRTNLGLSVLFWFL